MAVLIPTRTAQDVKSVDFVFAFDDTMLNPSGVSEGFASVAAHAFDVIDLPVGSVVVGGTLVTDIAGGGATAVNMTVGDSGSANRYLTTTDKVTAAKTDLLHTGFRTADAAHKIRVTVTPTVAAVTAGKWTLRLNYTTDGEAQYVL